jgi:predicted Zn-dependent protease
MRKLAACAAALLLLVSPGAQAQQQVLVGLSQSDRAQGAEGYRQIVQQFGGKVEGPLADYVRQVGLKVALVSVPGSRPQDWTITVLNSPVPNAMATPGGYLYITRAMDYFDLAEPHDGVLAKVFAGTKTRFCLISFDSDWLYPTAESRRIVHALNAAGAAASASMLGHSAVNLAK